MSARRRPAPADRPAAPADVLEVRQLLTTFTVTDGGDVTDAGDGETTFREALAAAEANAGADVIVFADGVDRVDLAADLGTYAGDLTIAGGPGRGVSGVVLDHAGNRGMRLTGGAFTFSGLTFAGADAGEGDGGALALDGGGSLTLDDVRFVDNRADEGGAIAVRGESSLVAAGGAFRGNEARFGGGADFGRDTSAVFTAVSFVGNRSGRSGGALYSDGARLTVTDAFAVENVAGFAGGDFEGGTGGFLTAFNDAEENGFAPPVVITGGRFTRNYATNGGGAISAAQDMTITDALFSKNRALARTDSRADAGFVLGGGAVSALDSIALVVADSTFFRNVADPDETALLDLLGADAGPGGTGLNAFSANGGALRVALDFRGTAVITNSKFRGNAAADDGGAVDSSGSTDARLRRVRMFDNAAGGRGGAVAVSSDFAAIGGRYAQNTAARGGGAFYADGFARLSLSDLAINRNVARRGGGGAVLAEGEFRRDSNAIFGPTVTLDRLFVARNEARGGAAGGAIASVAADLIVKNSNLAGNSARGNGADGGNVAVIGQKATFRNTILRGGEADRFGGGLFVGAFEGVTSPFTSAPTGAATVRFSRGGLVGNDAGRGGGAYVTSGARGEDNRLNLDGGFVARGNRANTEGGGLFLARDVVATLADAVFRDNAPDDLAGPGRVRRG